MCTFTFNDTYMNQRGVISKPFKVLVPNSFPKDEINNNIKYDYLYIFRSMCIDFLFLKIYFNSFQIFIS